jgi:hypothetical protein
VNGYDIIRWTLYALLELVIPLDNLFKGLIILLAYTPFDAHQFRRAAHSSEEALFSLNLHDTRIELSTTVIVIPEVLENVVHGALDQLACDGQALWHPQIMFHLLDEQKT